MKQLRVVGVIPARYGSTRLPGKPLKLIKGKPLIQWVYERVRGASILDLLYVATDDLRIADEVIRFGGHVIMTSEEHRSGTDRVAEAVELIDADIVVNIQGDQPFIDPIMIEEVVTPFYTDDQLNMVTLMHKIKDPKSFLDPSVVKVVTDHLGNALYFSRSLIPYPRESIPHDVYEHVGLYAYRKSFLLTFSGLAPSKLELIESLEQLRALEYGFPIRVVETKASDHEFTSFSVDTLEDLLQAERFVAERGIVSSTVGI